MTDGRAIPTSAANMPDPSSNSVAARGELVGGDDVCDKPHAGDPDPCDCGYPGDPHATRNREAIITKYTTALYLAGVQVSEANRLVRQLVAELDADA